MEEIEKYLLAGTQRDDVHRVSKYLQIKQWVRLYSSVLRTCSEEQLNFIREFIWPIDCWDFVGGLKGVKLNRCYVGKKLLAPTKPENPLNNLQKYMVACYCSFKDEIEELANRDCLKETLPHYHDRYTNFGELVKYWTEKIIGHTFNLRHDLHIGFQSAIKDNNVEALNYFWNELRHWLPQEQQKKLLIHAATCYHLPFNDANNEVVVFAIYALHELGFNDFSDLLQRDLEDNQHYSTLHHLVRNFDFLLAQTIYNAIDPSLLSYFDYATLMYSVLYHMESLPFYLDDLKFYHAGYNMVNALNCPSTVYANILGRVEGFRQYMSPDALSRNIYDLRETIKSDLENANPRAEWARNRYRILRSFHKASVKDILEKPKVLLDQIALEKALDRCYNVGDDSSDEEDTVMSYDKDKACEKLEEFNKKHAHLKTYSYALEHNILDEMHPAWLEDINAYSNFGFIAHAVSIKLLYSPAIQSAYYEKKRCFRMFQKLPNYYEICRAVDGALNQVGNGNTASSHNFSTKKEINHIICNVINTNPVSFVNAIINTDPASFSSRTVMKSKLHAFFLNHLPSDWNRLRSLGWNLFELETLYSIPQQSSPNMNFDISQWTSNFAVNFFSNLRFYSRVEKRKAKRHYITGSPRCQNATWKYSESAIVKIKNENYNEKRRDQVQFERLGTASYRRIYYAKLLSLGELYQLPDIFTKRVNQISIHAASLHHLLFGTEVMRNPSALVHNMMIFDLMKNGKLTWEAAIVDNKMPMSIESAVPASRIKNAKYDKNYMPLKYSYESGCLPSSGTSFEKKNYYALFSLLEEEKLLTVTWLEMKCGENFIKERLDEKKDLKIEYVKWFFDLLQEACQDWYKINITTNPVLNDVHS